MTTVAAQGLLVKTTGDTLTVTSYEIENGVIHFIEEGATQIQSLPLNRLREYIPDTLQTETPAEVENENIVMEESTPTETPPTTSPAVEKSTIRLSVRGGWSSLIGKISDEIPAEEQEFLKDLKTGMHLGAGLDIYFHRNIGVGAVYTLFRTNAKIDSVQYQHPETEEIIIGSHTEDIIVQYFGPRISTRVYFAKDRAALHVGASAGNIWYKNNGMAPAQFVMKSSNMGTRFDLGLDYHFADGFILSLETSALLAVLKKYKIGSPDGELREFDFEELNNISRVDISVALRWYL